jgi:hypothetical protein
LVNVGGRGGKGRLVVCDKGWHNVTHIDLLGMVKLVEIAIPADNHREASMKRFTDSGRRAIKDNNLYAALSLALTIPDICGSLEDPGTGKSQARYKRWFDKWAVSKFTTEVQGKQEVFMTAEDCFQLRCSLIHSGSAEIEQGKGSWLDRFVFVGKEFGHVHLFRFNNVVLNGVKMNLLQLQADLFSESMYCAAEEWDKAVANDAQVQAEKKKLLVIQTKPFVIGGASGI